MLIVINIILLCAFFILLIAEERRYRLLSSRITEKQRELIALSHQLRTPFIALKKYNSFLLSREFGKLSFAQMEVLNRMEKSSSDILVVLNRLLAASKLEEGEIDSDVRAIDMRSAVLAALDALSGLIHERGHTVDFRQPQKAVMIKADPLLLHGVLDELLQNAAAYTKNGGKIKLSVKSSAKDVSVTIEDNGLGIPKDEQSAVFQKFYRGRLTQDMFAGHGLGLAFARQFAKRMRGKVSFISTEGKGSAFTLTLPKA